MLACVSWRNSTSLAYLTLSEKYSERNFPLKASQVTGSSCSSMMDFTLIHQCFASPVSIYTVKANLFSAGHIFASNFLARSFSHWSAASGLVFRLNFLGWCFRKSSKLHSLTAGRGSGPKVGATALFSFSWRRASICCLWASSAATLAASIYCITNCCCSSDVAYRCIDASCCCIIAMLYCVIVATMAFMALAISGTSPWEYWEFLRGGAIVHWHTGKLLVRLHKTWI